MKQEDFLEFKRILEKHELEILSKKGKEYARSETDALSNFKRLGTDLGINPLKVMWIFLKKHLDGILSYIKEGREFSEETIYGRINDARNYLLLIAALIKENEPGSIFSEEGFINNFETKTAEEIKEHIQKLEDMKNMPVVMNEEYPFKKDVSLKGVAKVKRPGPPRPKPKSKPRKK